MIARALGMPLSEVLRMPAVEYSATLRHFARHPPGDLYAHHLLAAIWAVLVSALGRNPASPFDIAPWLSVDKSGPDHMKRDLKKRVLAITQGMTSGKW